MDPAEGPAQSQRLVEMLGRREIPLIEDDIYGDLHFGDARPRPAKAFDRRLAAQVARVSEAIAEHP